MIFIILIIMVNLSKKIDIFEFIKNFIIPKKESVFIDKDFVERINECLVQFHVFGKHNVIRYII